MRRDFVIIALMCVVALLAPGALSAQGGVKAVADRLSRADTEKGSRVSVIEHGDAGAALRSLEALRSRPNLKGYRVRIFFDNSQNAREMAIQTEARFKSMYPGIPVYLSYENPYFKVSAGDFITDEEAIMLWGRIRNQFEKAFVTVEDIAVSSLAKSSSLSFEENKLIDEITD